MFLLSLSPALPAQKCTDQPLRFYVYPTATLPDGVTTVPTAIRGDGDWYANGSNLSATIKFCSGTYDAVLNLLVTQKRKLVFDFPAPIPNSFVDTQIPAGAYVRNGFLNVRNLICRNCGVDPHSPFTTRVGMEIRSLLNNRDFKLRHMPLTVDAIDYHTDASVLPEENTPYASSPALVIPQPYNCHAGGSVKPAWVVRGALPNNDPNTPAGYQVQVGTAHEMSASPMIRAGQYSMPFELRIEALKCFDY